MNIIAYMLGLTLASSSTMYASVTISFVLSGTLYNVSHQFTALAAPNTISGLTINAAVRNAISDWVNTNYGCSTNGLDVVLGGAFALPVL